MGVFNATSTYGRGFTPTQVADQFLLRVYTGGVAGQREADKGAEKEVRAFLPKECVERQHSLAIDKREQG